MKDYSDLTLGQKWNQRQQQRADQLEEQKKSQQDEIFKELYSGIVQICKIDEKDTCTSLDLLLSSENESKATMLDLFNTVKFFTR